MTYDEARTKLQVLYELGFADVRVNYDIWRAYRDGVKYIERHGAAHTQKEETMMFRNMVIHKPYEKP